MYNILLGVTGSVATTQTAKVVESLKKFGDVKVCATKSARYFMDSQDVKVYFDEDEWPGNFALGNEVLHIELRKWASVLVIAPLDANTLAKLSHGICDNLLTCVYRAWDWTKPVVVAPAMNTAMWLNEPTGTQITALKARGVTVVEPVEKLLACKDFGIGAMAHSDNIAEAVKESLRWIFPLKTCSGIPVNHPGAFGFRRKHDTHTGIDLYCQNLDRVFAVESGTVVKIEKFTGPSVGHDWWEETWGIMVEGPTGVVNYGEVHMPDKYTEALAVGQKVCRGQQIARVKRVLFEDKLRRDIPGHSTSMLHLELYRTGTREFADWNEDSENQDLLDPTPLLMESKNAPQNTLSWDNPERAPE